MRMRLGKNMGNNGSFGMRINVRMRLGNDISTTLTKHTASQKSRARDGDRFMLASGFLMLRFQLDAYLFACTDNNESGRQITFSMKKNQKTLGCRG